MLKSKLLAAPAVFVGRAMTHDVAFTYRMGAGFAGDVNRTHPFSTVAGVADATSPPTFYGQPVIRKTDGTWRAFVAGDTALTSFDGITVRPYPFQASDASNYGAVGIGSAAIQTGQAFDVLLAGFIFVKVNGAVTPTGAAYVWCAASAGSNVQGQFESAASAGNTAAIAATKATFFSPPDANGVAELQVR